ncbi:MAG: TRAP transporter small permease [Maritimibacter sp.]|nr:TRAP transporter small permease [Maritimibacter sp.]
MRALSVEAWSARFGRATAWLTVLSAVILLFMVGLIGFGVIMRYVVGQPILGINEIVQLGAVALVMTALPYTTHVRGHVRADIFDGPLGHWGRFAGDLLTRALSIATLWVLVGRAWDKALDALEFGDETNMLGLPIWPVYGFIAGAVALTIVVMALQFLTILFSGEAMDD